MLALAMATITRPKLFLIDELSLGLSPLVVEQLLRAIESMRQAGTAILLVEQSMNVAVAVADRVYVMETGVVRFSGSAEELAAHPELLWSVYLEKASETLGAPGGRGATPQTCGRRAPHRARGARGLAQLRGQRRPRRRVRSTPTTARSSGSSGRTGRARPRSSTSSRGSSVPTPGGSQLGGVDVTDRTASARARLGLGRSFQDSRLVLRPHRARRRGRVAGTLHRRRRPLQRHAAAARCRCERKRPSAQRVDELLDMFGLDRFADNLVSELSTGSRRLVDLAAVVAHQPSVVLLDEPSSGVAQREVEAMVGLLADAARPPRRHIARRRARHRLHCRAGRSPRGDGPRRRAPQRAPARCPRIPRGRRGLPRLGPAGAVAFGHQRRVRARRAPP